MFAVSVIVFLFQSVLTSDAGATDIAISKVRVSQSSASEHQIQVWFGEHDQGCHGTSVWIAVPRKIGGWTALAINFRIGDITGKPLLDGSLALITMEPMSAPERSADSAKEQEHPIFWPGGFHGATICIRNDLLETTHLEVPYGIEPPGQVAHVLDLGLLSDWHSR